MDPETISDEIPKHKFSALDIHFIMSSLETKTDQEIADVLEVEVGAVIAKINEITAGGAFARNDAMQQRKDSRRYATIELDLRKLERKIQKQEQEEKIARRQEERLRRLNMDEARRVKKEQMNQFKNYQTRKVDYSKMKLIRIDHRTHIYVPIDSDVEEERRKYIENSRVK